MLRHYLLVAARIFARHKLYSFINVLGLSVALTCVIFVIMFVRYEVSYDKWIPETRRIYRVELTSRHPGKPPSLFAASPYPLGTAMRGQVPGVIGVTRLLPRALTLTHDSRQFLEKGVDFVDPDFFQMIHLPFIEGNPDTALNDPDSVVLSESVAREYFGSVDPMGRTLTTDIGSCATHDSECRGRSASLRVTGIVRDLPKNTQLAGTVFIPTASLADPTSDPTSYRSRQRWFGYHWFTYILVASGVKPAAILSAMPSILDEDVTGRLRKYGYPASWRGSQALAIHLTPFTRVHLASSRWQGNLTPPGSWVTVEGVIIVGILILLTACFNFTNLATALAGMRAREIGLRKMAGATRKQVIIQFLGEAVVLTLLSLVCAAVVAEILLPAFNGLVHQTNTLNYASDWKLDLILIGLAIGAGLMSGIYPALVLSRLRPVAALQRKAGAAQTWVGLRDILVLLQFAVSIALGTAAFVVYRQVDYARNLDLGFRRNNIVIVHNSNLSGGRQEAFAQALRANPGVLGVGMSDLVPFGRPSVGEVTIQVPGQASRLTLNLMPIDPAYARVYGIALVAGRLLSASRGDDRATRGSESEIVNILVNVAAARMLGFTAQEAVGNVIMMSTLVGRNPFSRVRIVGVLSDTKMQGARGPVMPEVYAYVPSWPMNFSVRLRSGRIPHTLALIDRTWRTFLPTVAIQRSFLNTRFEKLNRLDEREGTVLGVFVSIAIFIACLGLYGLVVFTAERRTKEVAIRKISGARTVDIMRIMLWRILMPVLLGSLLAWPVAYYYLQRWLQNFAHHISLSPAYFLASGLIALLVAWATVFLHTLRLALGSPIDALRYE